ncbi:hypothetical protein [Peptoniphilus raoultii]|uniref:hypothetical protein n=1 Tax=Peptoniphilus raoultii TaxID=1776387 RepID=UPI0008D8F0DA|nr:hypothetical protein [Peptoniphilus raoultii]
MYNSLSVRVSVKLADKFKDYYKFSKTGKILEKLNFFSKYKDESFFYRFFNSKKSIFKNSIAYKIYRGIFNLLNALASYLAKILRKTLENSISFGSVINITGDFDRICGFIFTLALYTSIASCLIGFFKGYSIKLNIFIMVISIFCLLFKGSYGKILRDSKVISFVKDFFLLDKEEEEWW